MQFEGTAIDVDTQDFVATVTLKGPGKGNALGPDVWRELPEVFEQLDRAGDVRVAVVRGSGDHFSYGLDLNASGELVGMITGNENLAAERLELKRLIRRWQDAITAIERCRKPVVAAVDGWCIGGGVDMIAACDVRIASARATFSVREVKLAIVPDLGSLQRLPPLIGQGQTRRLALSGEDIPAVEAARIGLVDILADDDDFDATVSAYAAEVAANPPLVVQGIKEVLNHAHTPTIDTGLDHVSAWNAAFLQSQDLQEAFIAFMERRAPEFKGK
jgi:enoyl-CoA hydratase